MTLTDRKTPISSWSLPIPKKDRNLWTAVEKTGTDMATLKANVLPEYLANNHS